METIYTLILTAAIGFSVTEILSMLKDFLQTHRKIRLKKKILNRQNRLQKNEKDVKRGKK